MPPKTPALDPRLWRKLAEARNYAMRKSGLPYLATAVASLRPRPVVGLGTFGVSAGMVLGFDPVVLDRWSVAEVAAVLLHEVGHPLRGHAARCTACHADPRAYNRAGDREINDDLVRAGVKLPETPCLPADIGMPDGRTAEEYLLGEQKQAEDARKKQAEESPPSQPAPAEDEGEDEPAEGDAPAEGDEGEGDEGEGEDEGTGEGEPAEDAADGQGAGEGDPSEDAAEGAGEGRGAGEGEGEGDPTYQTEGRCGSGAGAPQGWEEAADDEMGASAVEVAQVRREVAEAIIAAASTSRGSVSAGWKRWAEQTVAPARLRWQDLLRRLVTAKVRKAGAGHMTWNRVSRRQSGVGFGSGRPVVPGRVRVTPETWVALDTSGSMGDAEIQGALGEVAGIIRAVAGPVTYLSCDASIHGRGKVRTWQEAAKLTSGGGGTDFRPVFDAVEKAPRKPDCLVFVTDGYGPAPAAPPHGTTVIWVLVGPYAKTPPVTWGHAVRVDNVA